MVSPTKQPNPTEQQPFVDNQAEKTAPAVLPLPDLQITEAQKFDPRFKWLSTSEVREQTRSLLLTGEGFDKGQKAHIELINRADSKLWNFDIGAFKESAGVLLKALQQGKDVAAIDGKVEFSDTPLSLERRLQFHVAINSDCLIYLSKFRHDLITRLSSEPSSSTARRRRTGRRGRDQKGR